MTHHMQWLYTTSDTGTCEIFNGERLLANLRHTDACGIFTVSGTDCKWSNGIFPLMLDVGSLDGNGVNDWPYLDFTGGVTDLSNPAPWWDGVNGSPSSRGYGFWIEEWTGLDSAHVTRAVSQRAGRLGGANFGPLTSGSRVWKMNVILVGADGGALEAMFRWLETTLFDCCNACGGEEMLIRTSCPPQSEPAVDVYRARGAALIEGLTWEEPPIERLGCLMRRVSFTIGVADPCLYACAESCVNQQPFDFLAPCVPIHLWIGCNVTCAEMEPYRICCPIDAASQGLTSPVVTLENEGTLPTSAVRIYGMTDPLNIGCDPCSLVVQQNIVTHPIPPGSALRIDSSQRKVLFRSPDTGQEWVDGTAFLNPEPGFAPSFLSLAGGLPGWVAVEPVSFCGSLDDLLISVDIVSRVGCC